MDATHAVHDVYSSWILGDDAGKSASLTLVLSPAQLPTHTHTGNGRRSSRLGRPPILNLGMTFIEINGRAYVQSVAPNSEAAKAGIQPQDAVQYAAVFPKEWGDLEQQQEEDEDTIQLREQHTSGLTRAERHAKAIQMVLHYEDKGMRISYDELRALLAEAMDPTQSAFCSPPTAVKQRWAADVPPIPVNICVPVVHEEAEGTDSFRPSSPFSGERPRPVVFCFRRTRQRHKTIYLGNFRLDDECDAACRLVQQLAPTNDMDRPDPDTWAELVHDGTDWLLGNGSILPPKGYGPGGGQDADDQHEEDPVLPLDEGERQRAEKLALLRSRMAAEAMLGTGDRSQDMEAMTIRGMIQKAVGLAFVRASKVVLGVSIHVGSGIVLSRLSDGTWSAPSAIGVWGLGLGIQFGLEVAEYIFILQTPEALEHFKRGGSFTVGGNVGAAVAGMGREAYGAASVSGVCGSTSVVKDDEYNDTDSRQVRDAVQSTAIAPIVAYAKSQGLYVGVSLEGSRIFSRDDMNSRTYKFGAGRDVSSHDILSGKVATPPEAEELYAALHSVEFTHEMSRLPRPPEILRRDSANGWYYNRSTLKSQMGKDYFSFLASLTKEETEECETFETHFKKFIYGGVSVQRLLPDPKGRRTGKERRTLWLMLPEVGSLRLGFVSKLSDGDSAMISNKNSTQRVRREDSSRISVDGDIGTVGSEEVTLDSAFHPRDPANGSASIGHIRNGNVQLSSKHSVSLTDVTILSQEPPVPIRFKGEDKMAHLRVISIVDSSGTSLLFLANNFREAELLVCGLKLLIERETTRLGVRGGMPKSWFGLKKGENSVSPSAARGFEAPSSRLQGTPSPSKRSGYTSSDVETDAESLDGARTDLPDDRRNWGNVPGRDYMRVQAAGMIDSKSMGIKEQGVPQYIHGHPLFRELSKNVRLPLPLPLCRVLLLDSTSPVIRKWEHDRGDHNFEKSRWAFPPATPRELEKHSSEHQLIASGSMCNAHRTISFDRPRYGSLVRLSETHTVEADEASELVFTVTERNPRRGFSIKVRVNLRAFKDASCDATVVAEIRPVGKDMSNQAAVHKASLLVVEELRERYGEDSSGLLAGFMSVVDSMADESRPKTLHPQRPLSRTNPTAEEKKIDYNTVSLSKQKKDPARESGLVSFADMLRSGSGSPDPMPVDRPGSNSARQQLQVPEEGNRLKTKPTTVPRSDSFEDKKKPELPKEEVLIEVKPLPKIRLSLMPAPREEDEENSSTASPLVTKSSRRRKPSAKPKRSRSKKPSSSNAK
jgi:lipid-binding SYLF domain-containing protein